MSRRILIAILALAFPAVAQADAIYGCWTNGAERLVVDYQRLVTPGGASPEAQIDRHTAIYVSPVGERDAGRLLVFRQLNDLQVMRAVSTGTGGDLVGEREIWRPCDIELNS